MQSNSQATSTSLDKSQKQAIGLLSIGTFLEYFDLMLYVHMAVLLNALFFPASDPLTASIYSALAFCSTYVLRPFGALIFGYIGDRKGRKVTVVITTIAMSISCCVMAVLPTYAQIGIWATLIVTVCRIVQGMTSMAEVVGADIYVTEITKPPIQYPAVALSSIFATLGSLFALGVGACILSYGFNWRLTFWFGATVAAVGAIARRKLRETKDFSDAKLRMARHLERCKMTTEVLKNDVFWNEKVNKKSILSLFFMQCSFPVCFYFSYMYCGEILKNQFGFTPEQIIYQNFIVSIGQLIGFITLAILSYRIHPIKILKFKLKVLLVFILICPYLLNNVSLPYHILLIQLFVVLFCFTTVPAEPILYKSIPVFKRFTYASFVFAIGRAFTFVITSFGWVLLKNQFGHWGVIVMMLPIGLAFTYAVYHFEELDKKKRY